MPQSLSSATSTPAVAAFLRGVDRRARLLALIQTGDSTAAQGALAVAARVFASEAGQWPIAQWPMQYWRLLLSVPAMGQRRVDGDQADVLPEIARLTPALRAAVLLHLVASLEDTDAAAALGLDVGSYQQRIRSALPHNLQGDPDLEVWRGWRDAAQRALGRLPETVEAVQSPPQPTRAVVAEPAPVRNRSKSRERDVATPPGLQRRRHAGCPTVRGHDVPLQPCDPDAAGGNCWTSKRNHRAAVRVHGFAEDRRQLRGRARG